MMPQKVIIHNSISLDGSLTNFDVDMEIHYQIARGYKPDAHLIGSNTIKTGIQLYGNEPLEEKNDFTKPERDKDLPYWVIIDSKGSLQGLLHEVRRFEFCKDVVILISEETPEEYVNYLRKRNYDFHVVGRKHVNLRKSLELLSMEYNVKTILTDCGKTLSNLLLDKGLVDEISLLIHPVIVRDKSYKIFDCESKKIKLKLLKTKTIKEKYVWLTNQVLK
jgi:2,5-diamino-6-(ribosylamino)-4(3H)-pyrimidinone 5'-phosphate reductase